jgi:hypothetical protein
MKTLRRLLMEYQQGHANMPTKLLKIPNQFVHRIGTSSKSPKLETHAQSGLAYARLTRVSPAHCQPTAAGAGAFFVLYTASS